MLSVDEKTQIQALDRTQPMLPMRPGQVERHTHDYTRHGTACLFAALEVGSGQVTTAPASGRIDLLRRGRVDRRVTRHHRDAVDPRCT